MSNYNSLPSLSGSTVEVTVSYESLYNAAEQVRQSSSRIDNSCEELRNLTNKLPSFWDSDVCDAEAAAIRDRLETLTTLVRQFNQHAVNLRSIAQNYVAASGQVNATVQTLSSDVIV